MKKGDHNNLKILYFFVIFLFSFSCQQIDPNFRYYIRYEILELNENDNIFLVTLFDEIQSHDCKNFVRLGFSTLSKLFLEVKSDQKEFTWSAIINFKQNIKTMSIYEEFRIPLILEDAKKAGFKEVLEKNEGRIMVFDNDNLSLKIKYYSNGQIMIEKAKKKLKGGHKKIFHLIESKSSLYNIGLEKRKLLLKIKKEAEHGEKSIYEANRKFPDYYLKFEKIMKEMIQVIFEENPDYYFGWIDFGLSAASVDHDIKKALYYINKARELDDSKPTAYAMLFYLYFIENDSENMKIIEESADKKLMEPDRFQYDRIRIITLAHMGKKEMAEKIFLKRKILYDNEKYGGELKSLENSIKSRVTVKRIW